MPLSAVVVSQLTAYGALVTGFPRALPSKKNCTDATATLSSRSRRPDRARHRLAVGRVRDADGRRRSVRRRRRRTARLTLTVIGVAVATFPFESVTRALSVWLPSDVLPIVQLYVNGELVTGLPRAARPAGTAPKSRSPASTAAPRPDRRGPGNGCTIGRAGHRDGWRRGARIRLREHGHRLPLICSFVSVTLFVGSLSVRMWFGIDDRVQDVRPIRHAGQVDRLPCVGLVVFVAPADGPSERLVRIGAVRLRDERLIRRIRDSTDARVAGDAVVGLRAGGDDGSQANRRR